MQASRLELAARFQIPQRDLRLLDPWVPVPIPVSFLVRKHAILANFGAVRVLISRCEVCCLHLEKPCPQPHPRGMAVVSYAPKDQSALRPPGTVE